MIDEKFKIGLEFEIDDSSLEKARRDLESRLAASAAGNKNIVPGVTTTVRSMQQAAGIDTSSLAREIGKAVGTELAGFEGAIKQLTSAITDLQKVLPDLTKRIKEQTKSAQITNPAGTFTVASTPTTPSATSKPRFTEDQISKRVETLNRAIEVAARRITELGQSVDPEDLKRKIKLILTQTKFLNKRNDLERREFENTRGDEPKIRAYVQKSQERLARAHNQVAAELERQAKQIAASGTSFSTGAGIQGGPREQLASKQVGPTNTRLGANTDVTRKAGSERTSGGGGPILAYAPRVADKRVGTKEDRPSSSKAAQERVQARSEHPLQRGAESRVQEVNTSINELRNAIKAIPGLGDRPDLLKRIGLPEKATVGPGATAVITDLSREVRVVTGVLKIAEDAVSEYTNIVSQRTKELLGTDTGRENLRGIERLGRRRPEIAEIRLRKEMDKIFGDLPNIEPDKPMKPFQKGGEATLTFVPTEAEKERMKELGDEASIIAFVNRRLAELNSELSKLAGLGVQVAKSVGLAEEKAADIHVIREDLIKDNGDVIPGKGPIKEVQAPIQLRDLPAMGLGGAGAIREARMFQPFQVARMEEGELPRVLGRGEKSAVESGILDMSVFRELKTALVDVAKVPELREDQITYDPKLVKMDLREIKTAVVTKLGEGIAPGKVLGKHDVLGTVGEGEEKKEIAFDRHGSEAAIEGIEKIFIDGVEAFRIAIRELNETVTGMKFTERSGFKGIGRAVPDMAQKFGLPEGTAVAIGAEGAAKRNVLRMIMEMMSNKIADQAGVASQSVAEEIERSMKEGGQEITVAVQAAAEKFGLKNFQTAETMTSGPLAKAGGGSAAIMTGPVAWARLPKEGQKGEMRVEERFLDAPAQQALRLRAQTSKMADKFSDDLHRATQGEEEYIRQLHALIDATRMASENLRTIKPEDIKPLPDVISSKEQLKGTILDPELAQAFALQIPTKEGETAFRVPAANKLPSGRESFSTAVGTTGASEITSQIERIVSQAARVRTLRGEAPLQHGTEGFEEVAESVSKIIRDEAHAIFELGTASEEGAARARRFLDAFMPVVEALSQKPVGFQFKRIGPQGQPVGNAMDVKGTVGQYVESQKSDLRKVLSIAEILGERAPTVSGKPGRQTVSVPKQGEIHRDADVLNKVMQAIGFTFDRTSDSVVKAQDRLDKLIEQFKELYVAAGISRDKPESETRRSPAQVREGGITTSPIGKAVEVRTDISDELENVRQRLLALGATGKDVSGALSAFERISSLQVEKGIPRDVMLISKQDYDNLVSSIMKTEKMSKGEATSALERPGLLHRFPTTGGASLQATRLQVDETLPVGLAGIAGPPAISSQEDVKMMLDPLEKMRAEFLRTISSTGGMGEQAEAAARDLNELEPVLQKLKTLFLAAALNLDFDGDSVLFHADTTKKATGAIETFTQAMARGAVSFQNIFTNVIGKAVSKGGQGPLESYANMFERGVAKGRGPELQKAILKPTGPDTAEFEAFAHVAGKRSVGLLSDLFNRMQLSVTAGTKEVGDAFATGIEFIMLGINKSLAQKHGQGGSSGPMEFLEMFRKGMVNDIHKAMSAGEGFFGELENVNKQMQAELKDQLTRIGGGSGGLGRLKDFAAGQGIMAESVSKNIPEQLTAENFQSTISGIVNSLDLKVLINRMFEMMRENMKKALMSQKGLTESEAEESVAHSLMPQGKSGKIQGIEQRTILEENFPGYALTRKKSRQDFFETGDVNTRLQSLVESLQSSCASIKTSAKSGGEDITLASESMCGSVETFASRLKDCAQAVVQSCNVTDLVSQASNRPNIRMSADESRVGTRDYSEALSMTGQPIYQIPRSQYMEEHTTLEGNTKPEEDSAAFAWLTSQHLKSARGLPGTRVEPFYSSGEMEQGSAAVVHRNEKGDPEGLLLLHQYAKDRLGIDQAVDPAAQGKGIAQLLYKKAEEAGIDINSYAGNTGFTKAGAGLEHKRSVRAAVQEGKPVPDEVLKDYPDLQKLASLLQESSKEIDLASESYESPLKKFIDTLRDGANSVKSVANIQELPGQKLGSFYMGKGSPAVQLSASKIVAPFDSAMSLFERIVSGTATEAEKSAPNLEQAASAITRFFNTFAHENIHKASEQWTTAVENIMASFKSTDVNNPLSAKGPNQQSISKFMNNVGNVRSAFVSLNKVKDAQSAGAQVDPQTISKLQYRANRVLAEELLAHQVDPNKMAQVMGGEKVPESLSSALKSSLDELMAAQPDLRPIVEMSRGLSDLPEVLKSLVLASEASESPAAIRDAADTRIKSREIEGGRFGASRSRLAQIESAVMEGREAFSLRPVGAQQGRIQPMGPMHKVAGAEKMPDIVSSLEELNQEIYTNLDLAKDQIDQKDKEVRKLAFSLRARISDLQKSGQMSGANPQDEYIKVLQEWRAAVATNLINQARGLEDQLEGLRTSGKGGGPEFRDLESQLEKKVGQLHDYLAESLIPEGRGAGITISPLATPAGELLQKSFEAGIQPSPQGYMSMMQRVAGPGATGKNFISQMGPSITGAMEQLSKGTPILKVWEAVFAKLAEDPKNFKVNLAKVIEIFAGFSKLVGLTDGKFNQLASHLRDMSGFGRDTAKAFKGIDVQTKEQIMSGDVGATKQARLAITKGRGGTIESSIPAQYEDFSTLTENHRQQLQKLIKTPEYKNMKILTPHFEPLTKEIRDPETDRVVQKLSASFKRVGDTIKVNMEQGGAAVHGFSNSMQNALRRVVQWGMATGIVYGTMRAFNTLVSTLSGVESKVAELKKVMDPSITNFEKLQDAASSMGKEFGVAIEDVLDGMVAYGQQGLNTNEVLERTRATLMAVNVTTLSAVEATEALTSAMKIFDDETQSATSFVDAWGAVAAKHAVTAKELAIATQLAGAAAKAAGINYDDFMGIVTAIGSVTRQSGQEIATGVKFMSRAIRKPSAQQQLEEVGIKGETKTGDLRPGMEILGELAGKWDHLTKAQKINVAQAAAGMHHYNQFVVLMENWQEVLDASADAQNSQGFAARKNAIAMETFSKQMQVLRETVKEFALDVGKVLLPGMTMFVKVARSIFDVLNLLPDSFKQVGVAGAAAFLAISRAGDFVLDSISALSGSKVADTIRNSFKTGGIVGAGKDLFSVGPKKLGEMFKGGGAVMSAPMFAKGAGGMTVAADLAEITANAGPAAKALAGVKTALASTLSVMAANPIAIAAIAAGLATLGYLYYSIPKSGKEMEDALENQIGKSMDATQAFRTQARELSKLQNGYEKASTLVKNFHGANLSELIRSGDFKGPNTEISKMRDNVQKLGRSFAESDPAKVQGISETGDYILGIGDAYEKMAHSAGDAQAAVTAALQTRVITAYSTELTKATNIADRFQEVLNDTFGTNFDVSSMDDLKSIREEMKNLQEKRLNNTASGVFDFSSQEQWNSLVGKELELREQILTKSLEMKRVLESMPTFENLETASTTLGPNLASSLKPAVESGAFGRGATVQSVMFKQLSKSAGIGGMFDYNTASSPAKMLENLISKGATPKVGNNLNDLTKQTGDLAFISKEAAQAMLGTVHGVKAVSKMTDQGQAIEAARTLLVDVDKETGERIYRFADGFSNNMNSITSDSFDAVLAGVSDQGKNLVVATKQIMDEASERTRRILTLQFVGASAGIREPKNVNIGPARFTEVSAEQRMMGNLPDEIQRLSDIQFQIGEYAKVVNEESDTPAEGSMPIKQTKALTEDMLKMIVKLQEEGFQISVIAQYNKALEDLHITMEKSADSSRKLKVSEEARFRVETHRTGALAGQGVAPQLEFGKSYRELDGLERLQAKNPKLGMFLNQVGISGKQLGERQKLAVDLAGQKEDFVQMVKELQERGQELTTQQRQRLEAVSKGDMTKGDEEVIRAIIESGSEVQDIQQGQLSVQQKILEALQLSLDAEVAAGTPEERKKYLQDRMSTDRSEQAASKIREKLKTSSPEEVNKALVALGDTSSRQDALKRVLGLTARPGEKGKFDVGEFGTSFSSDVTKKKAEGLRSQLVWDMAGYTNPDLNATMPTVMQDVANAPLPSGSEVTSQSLMDIPEIADAVNKQLTDIIISQTRSMSSGAAVPAGAEDAAAALKKRTEEEARKTLAAFDSQIQSVYAEIDNSTAQLSAVEQHLNVARSISNFGKTIENILDEFKKAEMLHYTKINSDLEGPFARVGQPGFRTEFENRRKEISEKYNTSRPMTYEDMQQRDKDLAAVDFDEKEARTKQKQDVEVEALRQQQSQADSLRSAIAEALTSDTFAGDSDMENQAKKYLDTLTEQLATSEQATTRGGDLFFKGVPALDEARGFLQQINERSKEQLQQAQIANQAEAVKKGTEQLTSEAQQQTALLQSIDQKLTANTGTGTGTASALTSLAAAQQGLPAPIAGNGGPAWPGIQPVQAISPEDIDAAKAAGTYYGGPPKISMGQGNILPDAALSDMLRNAASEDFYSQMSGRLYNQNMQNSPEQIDYQVRNQIPGPLAPISLAAQQYQIAKDTTPSGYKSALKPSEQYLPQFKDMGEEEPTLLPESPDAWMKKVMADYANRGQRVQVFQPTGDVLSQEDQAGTGTVDLNKYYHGTSNQNLVNDWKARSESGNANAQYGTSLTTRDAAGNINQPGSIEATQRVTDQAGNQAASAQAEATQSLLEAIGGLQETLAGLSERGLQIPTELTTAISSLESSITDALSETLSVEVANAPLEVSIPDLESSFSSALSDSGIGSLGSDVASALLRLDKVESVVDPDGLAIDERIESANQDISGEIDLALQQVDSLESKISELDSKVTEVSTLVPDVTSATAEIEDLKSNIEEITEQLSSATVDVESIRSSIEQALDTVSSFEDVIDTVDGKADKAIDSIEDVKTELVNLGTTVESNKRNTEEQFRNRDNTITQISNKLDEAVRNLASAQSKAETSLSIAQRALTRI